MLTQRADLACTLSTAFADACTLGNHLYVVTQLSDFRDYNLTTLQPNFISGSVARTATGITLTSPGTAVVTYTSVNVDFIDVNTGARTNITTGTAQTNTTYSGFGQQVAGNMNNGFALATRNTGVTFINSITKAASGLNPSGIFTSQNSTVVTLRPTTDTWLVGSSLGQIYEINAQGALVQTLNLPVTPNTGTAQTTIVTGISFAHPNMACTTDRGELFVYNWVTQTLIKRELTTFWGGQGAALLCNASSGTCLMMRGHSVSSGGQPITELYFQNQDPSHGATFWNDANVLSRACGMEPSLSIAWLIFNQSNFVQIRTFDITPVNKVNVDSRFQDPPGTDVNARIIRLRDEGVGRLSIENDTNITDLTAISATDGHNYIELGIEGGIKFDIREFTA